MLASLKHYVGEVVERAKRFAIFDEFSSEDLEIAKKYARDTYKVCVAIYGRPLDSQKPYVLQRAITGGSFCREISGKFHIVIDKDATTAEQLCTDIAHEMYHRVTHGRKGFAGEMWVQEIMAFHTENSFLRTNGFAEYAEARKKASLAQVGKADAVLLRASKLRNTRAWLLRGQNTYSEDFTISLVRVGYALSDILDGNDLHSMIKFVTLEKWIASLPQEKQYAVCHILEIPSDGRKFPEDGPNLVQFFRALKAKGDAEAAVAEFQTVADFYPTNGAVAFYLAMSYEYAKEADAALSTYFKAFDLGYTDHFLPSNVGKIYYRRKEYDAAIEWFQRSIASKPNWAIGHYFLGSSLNGLGKVREAHKAWETVLTLDNEKFKTFARQAIEENPLPESEDNAIIPLESVPAT